MVKRLKLVCSFWSFDFLSRWWKFRFRQWCSRKQINIRKFLIREIREEREQKRTMNKINKKMMKIFDAEEENEIVPETKIKNVIIKVQNSEGFIAPQKPDMSQFNSLKEKTDKIKNLSSKFVENPRIIMKEVDKMKQLLMSQQRQMFQQRLLLRERQNAVVEALNSKEYRDSMLVYLEELEKERQGAQKLMEEANQVEQDLQDKIKKQMQELRHENNPQILEIEKQMKEFKPQNFTIEEYDKKISLQLKGKHPELFLSKEESEKWLKKTRDETDVMYLISSLVDDYEEDIQKLEKEQKKRNEQNPKLEVIVELNEEQLQKSTVNLLKQQDSENANQIQEEQNELDQVTLKNNDIKQIEQIKQKDETLNKNKNYFKQKQEEAKQIENEEEKEEVLQKDISIPNEKTNQVEEHYKNGILQIQTSKEEVKMDNNIITIPQSKQETQVMNNNPEIQQQLEENIKDLNSNEEKELLLDNKKESPSWVGHQEFGQQN